jgi:predicted O-methyltransferase YrrM
MSMSAVTLTDSPRALRASPTLKRFLVEGVRLAAASARALTVREYADPFTHRLAQLVPGMQQRGNLALMRRALKEMPDNGVVLEIGCFAGRSSCLLTYLLDQQERPHRLVACDPWDYTFKGLAAAPLGTSAVSGAAWGEHAAHIYREHVAFFCAHRLPHTFRLSSDDLFARWGKEPLLDVFGRNVSLEKSIAFAFIDGNHDYAHVSADIRNTDARLVPGGLMLLDDSACLTGCTGVRRAAAEWLSSRTSTYEIVAREPNALLRKRAAA